MGLSLPERQKWLEHALQGLAFWIGHRHSLFEDYPLPEGALVAEACNLIQANLPRDLVLMPECMYKNLVGPGSTVQDVGALARAGLVICATIAKKKGRDGNLAAYTKFVIEVKRGNASKRSTKTSRDSTNSFRLLLRELGAFSLSLVRALRRDALSKMASPFSVLTTSLAAPATSECAGL